MRLPTSIHTRTESYLTASMHQKFIKKAKELGRTHFAYADIGYTSAFLRTFEAAKKDGLGFIGGVTLFFRDLDCEFYKKSGQRNKFFMFNLYFHTQEQLSKFSELQSAYREKITYFGEEYPVFNWGDLQKAADIGLTFVHHNVQDMALMYILMHKPEFVRPIVEKISKMFGSRHYLSIYGVPVSHFPATVVKIQTVDREIQMSGDAYIKTEKVRGIRAVDFVDEYQKHQKIISYQVAGVTRYLDTPVIKAERFDGKVRFSFPDPQLECNELVVQIGKEMSIPVLYSDDAFYVEKNDKTSQDVKLAQDKRREARDRYMQTTEEAVFHINEAGGNPVEVFANIEQFANQFKDFDLKFEVKLPSYPYALQSIVKRIKDLGRLPDDQRYRDRLKYEIDVLHSNGKVDLLPYFMPIIEVTDHYHKSGYLTSAGRGSVGGCLLAYLIGITEVDPIKYDLSFERFLSLDRILAGNLPDIDHDSPSRIPLVGEDGKSGFLFERWGDGCAQISTRTNIRLKLAIKDVHRALHGSVPQEIEKLTKGLPSAPQGVSDSDYVFGYTDQDGTEHKGLFEIDESLRRYAEAYPKEWEEVKKIMGVSRGLGIHAAAFVLSDEPIAKTTPVFGRVTQYEAKYVEKSGLVKYDFLVVNQINDVQTCLRFITEKNRGSFDTGYFEHKGKQTYIWDLPDDQDVYKSVWDGNTTSLFQINTTSMAPFVQKIMPRSIEDLAVILALVRPGPLDYIDPETGRSMAEEYIERRNGGGSQPIKEMLSLLPETYGIQIYQEQNSKVAKAIGKMDSIDAENLRRAFAKKDKRKVEEFKPKFMAGAIETVGEETAKQIWAQMETSSRYNFNKSHAVGYSLLTYSTMFLRHHYPLEWWAAVFTNAEEKELSEVFYNQVRKFVLPPDINLSEEVMKIDYSRGKIVSKITALKGIGKSVSEKIVAGRPYTSIKDLVKRCPIGSSVLKKMAVAGVLDSLFTKEKTVLDKMICLETALAEIVYENKLAAGIKAKEVQVKVDEEYAHAHPLKVFQKRKQILATMPLSLSQAVVETAPTRAEVTARLVLENIAEREAKKPTGKEQMPFNEGTPFKPVFSDSHGNAYPLINGEGLKRLEESAPIPTANKYRNLCVAAYVIEAKEFSYQKNTRKAFKMIVDIDGFMEERVLWPDYNTGKITYPDGIKKGSLILLYMTRDVEKLRTYIKEIRLILS